MTSQRRVADSGFTSGLGVPCREEAERGRRCRRGALKNRAVAAVTYDAAIGLGANLGDPGGAIVRPEGQRIDWLRFIFNTHGSLACGERTMPPQQKHRLIYSSPVSFFICSRAASSSGTSKLLTPHRRILPFATSCSKASMVASSGWVPDQWSR